MICKTPSSFAVCGGLQVSFLQQRWVIVGCSSLSYSMTEECDTAPVWSGWWWWKLHGCWCEWGLGLRASAPCRYLQLYLDCTYTEISVSYVTFWLSVSRKMSSKTIVKESVIFKIVYFSEFASRGLWCCSRHHKMSRRKKWWIWHEQPMVPSHHIPAVWVNKLDCLIFSGAYQQCKKSFFANRAVNHYCGINHPSQCCEPAGMPVTTSNTEKELKWCKTRGEISGLELLCSGAEQTKRFLRLCECGT